VTDRLSLRTLGAAPAGIRPRYDPLDVRPGILHLGAGAFFRAHLATYADDVIAAGEHGAGVVAVSPRSPVVSDALTEQDGLFTLVERATDAEPAARVVGSVRRAICAAADPGPVLDALADPAVELVTLTVTEQAYPATADRRLRIDAEIEAELAGGPPRSVAGLLVRGIERRRAAGAGPLTVACCDNLLDNGALVRTLVAEFADRLGDTGLRDWIDGQVRFPSTVVDRIVPASTDADRAMARRLTTLDDVVPVVTEPFRQWVVGGDLPGDRDAWCGAGVTFAPVDPYEQLKLRILNASHSLISYLGVLAGYDTIAEAVRDPVIEAAGRAFVDLDQLPTVVPPEGVDVAGYRDEVFRRFANPLLRHTTTQVATDGSKKLPQRLLPAVREARAAGRCPELSALALAAWIRIQTGYADGGRRVDVPDPWSARVRELAGRADVVPAVLREVFGIEDRELAAMVGGWYDAIGSYGVLEALRGRSVVDQ
jgi:fructuronate reductase